MTLFNSFLAVQGRTGVFRRAAGIVALAFVLLLSSRSLAPGQFDVPAKVPAESTTASAPQLLSQLGLDESSLSNLRDGEAVDTNDREPLARLLYVLPRIDLLTRYRWEKQPAVTWQACDETPEKCRLQMLKLRGTTRNVQVIEVASEVARRFGFDHYYQLEIVEQDTGRLVDLFTVQVPLAWETVSVPNDGWTVEADAFFFKVGQGAPTPGLKRLIFATDRVAWYPQRVDAEAGISSSAVQLGRVGMDFGRFADLVQGHALVHEDREPFYQLLWACDRITPSSDGSIGSASAALASLITNPRGSAGQQLALVGTARRAVLVRVNDADIRERYGIDHYYEIDALLPIDTAITLRDPVDDQQIRYDHVFPVTLCVRELPTAMAQGDDVRVDISASAFFLKLRAYRSQYVDEKVESDAGRHRQLSPLLVAKTLSLLPAPEIATSSFGTTSAVILATVVCLTGIVWWCLRRSDRQFNQWRSSRERTRLIRGPADESEVSRDGD